jgi:hypothetical protein
VAYFVRCFGVIASDNPEKLLPSIYKDIYVIASQNGLTLLTIMLSGEAAVVCNTVPYSKSII